MISHGSDPGAVFVDRDGVICENRADHVKTWSEFVFLPGAIEALASLRRAGCRLVVVTNQSAVGRGLLSRRQLDLIHEKMLGSFGGSGAKVEAIMVCPHHPDDGCACRKPEPGMLLEAADRLKVDLSRSFMIGDHPADVEAGKRAGCETVLVRTGRWDGSSVVGPHAPDFVADDLVDAAIWVLGRRAMRVGRSGVLGRFSGTEVIR
jgi:D-glycero-D-manno-heptose 1,7-bisphosphate phosphatase